MFCLTSAWGKVGVSKEKVATVFEKKQRREWFAEDSTLKMIWSSFFPDTLPWGLHGLESEVLGLPPQLPAESITPSIAYGSGKRGIVHKNIVSIWHTNSSRWAFYSGREQDLLPGRAGGPVKGGVWRPQVEG